MKTPVRRLEATFASLLVVAVAATGCGSSSGKASTAAGASSGGAAVTTSAAATTTGAAAASAAGGAASTTGAAASTPAAVPPPSAAARTSVKATGGGDFCKTLAAFINDSQSFGTTPATVKASVQKAQAETLLLVSKAPSAIKTDLTTLFAATNALYAALAKANYDATKVPASALAGLSTPATDAAEKRVDAYVKTDCGIDVGASS